MADVENPIIGSTIEADIIMSPSLRKRNTANMNIDRNSKDRISKHQHLVMKINRASRTDDDDEDEKLKEKLMLEQMKSNKETARAQFQRVGFLLIAVIGTYLFLSLGSDTNNENKSGLSKALGILLGINRRNQARLPSWAKVVATSSVPTKSLDEYSYPSWPWSSNSNSNFLVPSTDESKRVRDILHRTTKLKGERGINVDLFSQIEITAFLMKHRQQCSNIGVNNGQTILDKYETFGNFGMMEAQKQLWLWCAVYTGTIYGFVDLDLYEVYLSHRFINDLSNDKIKNAILQPGSMGSQHGIDAETTLPILFIPNKNSTVAKSMLQFFMELGEGAIQDDIMAKSTRHLNDVLQTEPDLWTLLQADCIEQKNRWPLATVCKQNACCQVIVPKKS